MKRIVIYIIILAAMLAVPVEPSDVGKLRPVEVVSIYKEDNWTIMETDTGDRGMGGSPQQALANLKATSGGIIYLDTAQYLLLAPDALDAADTLRQELKASVRLCLAARSVDLEEAAQFLNVHGRLPKLKHWEIQTELPVLSTFGDSLIFLKKVENRT